MIEPSIALVVAGAILQELIAWVRAKWPGLDGDGVRAFAVAVGVAVVALTPGLQMHPWPDVVAFGYPWLDVLVSGLVMALGASVVNRIIRKQEPKP